MLSSCLINIVYVIDPVVEREAIYATYKVKYYDEGDHFSNPSGESTKLNAFTNL